MKLIDDFLIDGRIIPRGTDIDPSLIPDHVKKDSGLRAQPKKLVPKNYQGPRYGDAQGNVITNWDEHIAAQQEHLEAEQAAFEAGNEEIAFYDTRPGQFPVGESEEQS